MDWEKLIFTLAVALIGAYSVYSKDNTTAGVCLGIMGAILRSEPNTQKGDVKNEKTVSVVPTDSVD